MNKNCEKIQDRIAESLTEHFDPFNDDKLTSHLKRCSKCSQYLTDLKIDAQSLSDFTDSLSPVIARIENSICDKLGSELTTKAAKTNSIWRIIMNNRMARFASAAMIMIAGLLAIVCLEKSVTPAFGMTEAVNRYKNAKTIHMHGWVYMPTRSETKPKFIKTPIEYWFDLENGRYKMIKPGSIDESTGKCKYFFTTVSDGQYVMRDSYSQPLKGESMRIIRFEKLTDFHGRLQAHNSAYSLLAQLFGGVDKISGFIRAGDEVIQGEECGVWEGELSFPGPQGGMQTKIKSWLSLTTGELRKVQMWQKPPNVDELMLLLEIDQIEFDVEFPHDLFLTDPPKDCRLKNTKETAPMAELGTLSSSLFDRLMLNVHVAFTLSDGSVIVCWRSTEDGNPAQDQLFEDLTFGGQVPKLPIEIRALKPIASLDVEYKGYHLINTQKGNKFFEWSVYVPDKAVPKRNSIVGYKVIHHYNTLKKDDVGHLTLSITEDIQINTPAEYDTWILGAVKELSDHEQVPDDIDYVNVQELVRGKSK